MVKEDHLYGCEIAVRIEASARANMLIAGSIVRIHLLRNSFMERQLVVILPRRQQSPVIRERQDRPAGKASIHAILADDTK